MKKSTTYIVVAVVIVIIIIAAAAAYVYMNPSGGGATPTPTATATPTVVGQSTLQFNVDENTTGYGLVTYMYSFANLTWDGNTPNATLAQIRIDIPSTPENYSYIINAATYQAWSSTDSGATWTVDDFPSVWTSQSAIFDIYLTHLASWNGVDSSITYTTSTSTITIYSICPGPTLPDSLFTAS
jgi:hypothetical protein